MQPKVAMLKPLPWGNKNANIMINTFFIGIH